MVSIKKNDKLLPASIELSDAPQSRTRNDASTSRPGAAAVVDDIETGRAEGPSIVVNKGLSTKQKLGLGTLGLLGVGGLVSAATVAGVQTRKSHALQRQNNLLNINLEKADASNQFLQSQINSGSAAAAIPGSPVSAPPPVPALTLDEIRSAFNTSEETVPKSYVNQLAATWNMSDPLVDLLPTEQEDHGNMTYVNAGLPLFNEQLFPSIADIQINGGNPAAHALGADDGSLAVFTAEAVAGAAGAIAAANPEYITSLFTQLNVSGVTGVQLPLYFQTRANPFGFQPVVLTARDTVLTDNTYYARGTNPLRVVQDPMEDIVSGLQPNAVSWFPLLQKVTTKITQSGENDFAEGVQLDDTASVMQALTGNMVESRDMSRLGDADVQFATNDADAESFGSMFGVLQSLPSATFDANIARLYNSPQRAATFSMREGYQVAYFPNATVTRDAVSAHFNGMFFEPAMGGDHIHVKTDDGSVNEIFFAGRSYVWLGVSTDEVSGDLSNVTLADMSGATIDCNQYDQDMAITTADSDGVANWGLYGTNLTLLGTMYQDLGQPAIWSDLPLKSPDVTLPYKVFKQLAAWTTQADVPAFASTQGALYAPAAVVPDNVDLG